MNAQQIIEIILDEAGSRQAAIEALEDEAALKALGLTDKDQEAIEEAHFILMEQK